MPHDMSDQKRKIERLENAVRITLALLILVGLFVTLALMTSR